MMLKIMKSSHCNFKVEKKTLKILFMTKLLFKEIAYGAEIEFNMSPGTMSICRNLIIIDWRNGGS